MITFWQAGIAYIVFVFFKAFQQRNVTHLNYWPIMPISYCMSSAEVFVIASIGYKASHMTELSELIPYMLAIGTGGGLGAMGAMYLHNRFITERNGK